MEHLKYPVGIFIFPEIADENNWIEWKETIRVFPDLLENLSKNMTEYQLNTQYRPDGWTARQVIHHVADSHSHALIRFKWTLSEEKPTIKPYLEGKYALLVDYSLPVESALWILKGVHHKWTHIMDQMSESDRQKGYYHPETGRFFSLYDAAALYSWHCRHHLAHITLCLG